MGFQSLPFPFLRQKVWNGISISSELLVRGQFHLYGHYNKQLKLCLFGLDWLLNHFPKVLYKPRTTRAFCGDFMAVCDPFFFKVVGVKGSRLSMGRVI